jgi:hypothetical protein
VREAVAPEEGSRSGLAGCVVDLFGLFDLRLGAEKFLAELPDELPLVVLPALDRDCPARFRLDGVLVPFAVVFPDLGGRVEFERTGDPLPFVEGFVEALADELPMLLLPPS